MSWTPHDTTLAACALGGIAVIVLLISVLKVHPFLALIIGGGVVGLGEGLPASDVIHTFEHGFGDTLAGTGILVGLGTMLGALLAHSGGADRVVDTILRWAGPRRVPWAMALIAMVVGLPLFFEVGVVLLVPIIFLMARRSGLSVVQVGIPALAGLSVMHGLVAPHPGPLIAIHALGADLGVTMAYGLLIAVPTLIIAGPLYGAWIGKRVVPALPSSVSAAAPDLSRAPGFGITLFTVLLPVGLMLGRAVADLVMVDGRARRTLDFVGDPVTAMLVAVVVASFTFGYLRGRSAKDVSHLLGESLGAIAGIVLIIGGGGGFKQILVEGGVGEAIGKAAVSSHLSPLLVGWLIAVGIRLATGSATVATVTASGLMAPLVHQLPNVSTPLLALAIGAGSLFLSHVSDAGFWLIKGYFGMTVGETFATWSAMETIISVVGLVLVLMLALL